MRSEDAAIAFTLKYFELLETHLNVSWSADGRPVCVIDWIHDDAVDCLRADLSQLIQSDLEHEARQATVEYGREHVLSVGFGLAPDFGQFIKLGLIYGERVVIWDVIHSRILASDQPSENRKSLLAQVACNLLLLKSTVERGGVVLLAHPIHWSALAAEIDAELRSTGPVPAASLGLSLAFAAIEDGLPLHPYTLLAGSAKPSVAPAVGQQEDQLFSSENFRFQQCLTALLKDTRVAYLDDARVEDFFDIVVSHSKLRRALRKHFSPSFSGLSPQQAAAETRALVDELLELFEKQNAAIVDYAAEGVDASAKFMLATVSSTVLGQPLLGALAGLGSLAVHLSTAVRKWNKKPERNVIIQAFQAMEQSTETTQVIDLVNAEYQLSNLRHGHSSLGDLYRKFMSFPWTEERHAFLESLPPEVAKALLSLLSSEDLEIIVNQRRFQNDYIGDYLAYISELDEAIYWQHLSKTFESPEGLLIYDGDAHIDSMETRDMPLKIWRQLLDSLFEAHGDEMRSGTYGYPLERFPGIIRFQTEEARDKHEKRSALISFSAGLRRDDQQALEQLVGEAFDSVVPEWFTGE